MDENWGQLPYTLENQRNYGKPPYLSSVNQLYCKWAMCNSYVYNKLSIAHLLLLVRMITHEFASMHQ